MAKYRRICVSLAMALSLAAGPALAAKADRPADKDPAWRLCAETAAQIEIEQGLPAHILTAVSLTETGRAGPNRQVSTWPWTVHDGSRGYHFATQDEAIEFVRGIRTDGRRSIDVGCMQVNLRHHPRAFTSVAMGFDPRANIEYAAGFLKDLAAKSGSWEEAIAKYHTQNPALDETYAPKVLAFWARERARAKDVASNVASNAKLVKVGSADRGRVLTPASGTLRSNASALIVASAEPPKVLALPAKNVKADGAPTAAVPAGETGTLVLRRQFGSAP